MKPKFSGRDSKGKLYVDCTECKRGINGSDEDKCSAGMRCKKGGQGMCFCGDLIEKYDESKI